MPPFRKKRKPPNCVPREHVVDAPVRARYAPPPSLPAAPPTPPRRERPPTPPPRRAPERAPAACEQRPPTNVASLPRSLELLGNARAWIAVRTHVLETPHVPLLLHGPTGCGKTRGVEALLAHLGMRAVTLDAVEADDTAQLSLWIRRTREARTLGRVSVVVVDDLEGFTHAARAEVARLAEDQRSSLNPMLLVCSARRDPAFRALQALPDVRLFAPRERDLRAWFGEAYAWTSAHEGHAVVHTGLSRNVLDLEQDLLRAGDVRRLVTAFRSRNALGASMADAHDDHCPNAFEAARRLLRGTMPVDAWSAGADAYDVALVQHALVPCAAEGDASIEALADALDHVSAADVMLPDRYELRDAQRPVAARVHGGAARLLAATTPSPGGGAIAPPPRIEMRTRRAEEIQWTDRPPRAPP